MRIWRKIDENFEGILTGIAGLASFAVFLIMLLITADVISRLVFNKPFVGVAEIVSSIIVMVCFWQIPHVAAKHGHVRTTMLYDAVGEKGKIIIDLLAAAIGIIVYSFIIVASMPGLINAINIHEAEIAGSVRISTIPGRFSVIIGSALIILEFVNEICKYIYQLITGKSFDAKSEKEENA